MDIEQAPDAPRTKALDSFGHSGRPLATVYVPTPSRVDDAEQRLQIRQKNVSAELERLEASPQMIEAVQASLADLAHDEGEAMMLVADDERVLFRQNLIRPITRTVISLGPTPMLLPYLAATQVDVGHVAVLIDRTGADIHFRYGLGQAVETLSVSGDEEHIHRSHSGGWSQRRFQQRAENTWESNAKLVVEELTELIPDDIATVIVGGDVRSVAFFLEHVPSRFSPVVKVEGDRSADSDAFLDNVDTTIRSLATEELTGEVEAIRGAVATGAAVAGDETLNLLTQGRISRLLVADDSLADDRSLAAFDFSIPMSDPEDFGQHSVTAPRTEGAVALAVATGAEVLVVSPAIGAGFEGGLAGLVRG